MCAQAQSTAPVNARGLIEARGLGGQCGVGSRRLAHDRFELDDLGAEIGDEPFDLVAQPGVGGLPQTRFVPRAFFHQAVTLRHQQGETLRAGIRRRCWAWAHGRAVGGEHGGINAVGFGEAVLCAGEVARQTRVDDADGDACGMQGGDHGALITAGGLADDMHRARVPGDAFEQPAHSGGRVGFGEGMGQEVRVERELGDIDAEMDNIWGLASLHAARKNTALKALYQRLRTAGKPAKVALTAVARKLVELLNAAVKDPQISLA